MSVAPPSPALLADRAAITDVLHRYCRGIDRMDRALVLSCWHEGGTDEHTPLFSGTAEGFVDWVWGIHAAMVMTRHTLSNILIEVEGDDAWSESYWWVILRVRDDGASGLTDITGCGRYLDHFERRDDRWAIRHRRSVHDWDRVEPVKLTMATGPTVPPNNPGSTVYPSRRDATDPSYAFLGGHGRDFRPS
jgi:hypothetical protein